MPTLKDLSKKPDRFIGGHSLCPGCAESIIVRAILHATDKPVVVACATGCLEVSSTSYPYTSWRVPWIHSAFENTAAVLSGIVEAYKALKKKRKLEVPSHLASLDEIKFLALGGDGAFYDIGLQALSGAWERGHRFVTVCLQNGAYMNTGGQRSSATPYGAWTKTSEIGKAHQGKEQSQKDLVAIALAHRLPYLAQASPHNLDDLLGKAQKAFESPGPSFLNVLSPCVPGWKYPPDQTLEIARLASETCFWPLFEIEDGQWRLTWNPGQNKKPLEEWLKLQGRFKHLLKAENKHIMEKLQREVDCRWEELLAKIQNDNAKSKID